MYRTCDIWAFKLRLFYLRLKRQKVVYFVQTIQVQVQLGEKLQI
jgi:hypothetical protein